jgi:hypothetical protein
MMIPISNVDANVVLREQSCLMGSINATLILMMLDRSVIQLHARSRHRLAFQRLDYWLGKVVNLVHQGLALSSSENFANRHDEVLANA